MISCLPVRHSVTASGLTGSGWPIALTSRWRPSQCSKPRSTTEFRFVCCCIQKPVLWDWSELVYWVVKSLLYNTFKNHADSSWLDSTPCLNSMYCTEDSTLKCTRIIKYITLVLRVIKFNSCYLDTYTLPPTKHNIVHCMNIFKRKFRKTWCFYAERT